MYGFESADEASKHEVWEQLEKTWQQTECRIQQKMTQMITHHSKGSPEIRQHYLDRTDTYDFTISSNKCRLSGGEKGLVIPIPFLIFYQACYRQGLGWSIWCQIIYKGVFMFSMVCFNFVEKKPYAKAKKAKPPRHKLTHRDTDSVSDLFSPVVVLTCGARIARNLRRRVLRKLNQVGIIHFLPNIEWKCLYESSRRSQSTSRNSLCCLLGAPSTFCHFCNSSWASLDDLMSLMRWSL